ncbi:MAG: hypothetical protein AB7P04_09880 [Bacteriovoracia bacterium]
MKALDFAFWAAVAGVVVSFVMAIVTMNASREVPSGTTPAPVMTPAGT